MKIVKIIAVSACLITIGLVITCCLLKNPLDAQYEATVKYIMEKEQLSTETAVLEANPSLLIVKKQIATIKRHQYELNEYQRGHQMPAGIQESQVLSKKIIQIRDTKASIHQTLRSLKTGV